MGDKYEGGYIGYRYIRKFKTIKDKDLWDSIYRSISKYGGTVNQSDLTDELFAKHGKRAIQSEIKPKKNKNP